MQKIILFLIAINIVVFAQWYDVSPKPEGFYINDIAPVYIDYYSGEAFFLACDDGYLIRAHNGNFYTVLDTVLSGLAQNLNAIEIYNNRNVVIGGDNILLYSGDTLNTYQEIPVPEGSVIRNIAINQNNSSKAYLIGDNGFYGHSTDGGMNWNFDTLSTSNLNKIQVVNDSLLFIVGDGGLIMRSTDHGGNWEKRDSPVIDDLKDIKIISSGEGYLASKNIYSTSDFGENWELFSNVPEAESIYNTIVYHPYYFTFYEHNRNYVDYEYGNIHVGKVPGYGVINGAEYIQDMGYSSYYFGSVNLLGSRYSRNPFQQMAMENNGPFNQLQFLNDQTGFIAGWSSFYTEDGGDSWDEIAFPVFTTWDQTQIHFFSSNFGYAFLSDKLFKTTNTGSSWEELGYFPHADLLHFANEKTAFIVCDTTVYKSDDYAHTWINISLPHNEYDLFLASKMIFTNQSTGYIFGSGGFYYTTNDGGDSWGKIYTGVFDYVDAAAADENNIILVGYDYYLPDPYVHGGIVYITHNAGVTWTQKKATVGVIYTSVFADNTGKYLFTGNNNTLFYSEDFGDTWTEQDYPFPGRIDGFEYDHQNGLYAFDRFSSMIFHNPNLGFTVTEVETDQSNNELTFELNQNYPNPFNPKTNINFSLSESGKVKLTVYNLLGQEVDVLINTDLSAGNHTAVFEGSNLASGIYFYKLETNEFTSTKKMILMK